MRRIFMGARNSFAPRTRENLGGAEPRLPPRRSECLLKLKASREFKGAMAKIDRTSALRRRQSPLRRPAFYPVSSPRGTVPHDPCGQVRVVFIALRALAHVPVEKRNTPRGTVRISTPEVTALDLAGCPARVGGLGVVATIVSELAEAAGLVSVP